MKKLIEDFHIDDHVIDDPDSPKPKMRTPLVLAAHHNQPEIVRYLLSRGGKLVEGDIVSFAMEEAAIEEHADVVRALMEFNLPEAVLQWILSRCLSREHY